MWSSRVANDDAPCHRDHHRLRNLPFDGQHRSGSSLGRSRMQDHRCRMLCIGR